MRPVPPTPAMPRFADTSLLMMTEPIFGDVTLDDDDWLEPPTPGPSRIAAPKSVIRNKMLNRDAYLPIEEEDEDIQNLVGEDELQIPEEEMFSGRGEKPVERVGGASQSANTSLPRTSSPAISQRKTARGVHTDPRHYLSWHHCRPNPECGGSFNVEAESRNWISPNISVNSTSGVRGE